MSTKAFVYTELQLSVPFTEMPWQEHNAAAQEQPGFQNLTWLTSVGTHAVGGFYQFDSIANAQRFTIQFMPAYARRFGVAQVSRVFDGDVVTEASHDMNSAHFGHPLRRAPGAFVYTEAQIQVPFPQAPWPSFNPILKQQPGLLAKTWLSGVGNQSLGGFYAFDSLANATRFVTDYFPSEMAQLNVAYTTRLFDASAVSTASAAVRSPFFSR